MKKLDNKTNNSPSLIHGKQEGQDTDIIPGNECGQQANLSNVPLQNNPTGLI